MAEYDASERRHVKALARAAKLAARNRQEFLGHVMSLRNGREWLHDLLVFCNVFSISHTGNALNTAFNEGHRDVGLYILADIMKFCPDNYVVMMREANERDTLTDHRLQRSDENADRGDNEPGRTGIIGDDDYDTGGSVASEYDPSAGSED